MFTKSILHAKAFERGSLLSWLALALLASACSPTLTPSPPLTNFPNAAPPTAEGSSRGVCGTLRLLYWQAPTILNPHLAAGPQNYEAARLVYEPLLSYDNEGKPTAQFGLAEEVPTVENGGVSTDGKQVTWKLKKNVLWSDGSQFTADDVLFTWKYATDKATAASSAQNYSDISDGEKIDDYTVRFTLKNSSPTPYSSFTGRFGMIIQKKAFEDYMGSKAKDAPANTRPIGTGPFAVTEFKPGDVITFQANPNYRDPAKPCFHDVVLKGGGDAASAARAVLQTGDADYAWNLQVPAEVLKGLASGSNGELVSALGNSVELIYFNMTNPDPSLGEKRSEPDQPHPFLSDIRVRQALALGIDREAIEQLYGGRDLAGKATCNIINVPPAMVSTTKFEFCDYDLDKANRMLDEAGWMRGSDGIRHKVVNGNDTQMKILYQTSTNEVRQKIQQIIKQGWEQLGVSVEIRAVDSAVFSSAGPTSPDNASHFFADVQEVAPGASAPGDTQFLRNWTCAAIGTRDSGWTGRNLPRWCDKNFDLIVAKIATELDPAKRTELMRQANDAVVNAYFAIPLISRTVVAGKSKTLNGILPNPWDSDLWNLVDWKN